MQCVRPTSKTTLRQGASRDRSCGHAATIVASAVIGAAVSGLLPTTAVVQPQQDRTKCPDDADRHTALEQAIEQNTRQKNQAVPAGVPRGWSWYNGKSGLQAAARPPLGFSAVTGWGIVYPEAGHPTSILDANVFVRDFVTFLHLASGGWMEVQNQVKDPIDGAHFMADFTRNQNVPWTLRSSPDGSIVFDAPKMGHNDHFWPERRGTFGSEPIDGVFVSAGIKTDAPGAMLVAALGADWWRSATAEYENGFKNNPGIGQSNFVRLTTRWQILFFYSLNTEQFKAGFSNLPLKCCR
jgi:hypothetical protein